jgi:hypothetical protein
MSPERERGKTHSSDHRYLDRRRGRGHSKHANLNNGPD